MKMLSVVFSILVIVREIEMCDGKEGRLELGLSFFDDSCVRFISFYSFGCFIFFLQNSWLGVNGYNV